MTRALVVVARSIKSAAAGYNKFLKINQDICVLTIQSA